MSETKILRCPFCGGEAVVLDENPYHWVVCKKCDCEAGQGTTIEGAIKRWNTRIPMQNIVERLEEIECKCHDDYIENLEKQNTVCTNVCFGKMVGVQNAIEIVKEEGGSSE